VRDRWLGLCQPGEYIDGMPDREKEQRVEQIIDQFRGWGWPPEGWDGMTLPEV
jgi:hypothetical protein